MKFANATKFNRKSREAEGSAVLLIGSEDSLASNPLVHRERGPPEA
jgi:hypothetical protein